MRSLRVKIEATVRVIVRDRVKRLSAPFEAPFLHALREKIKLRVIDRVKDKVKRLSAPIRVIVRR